MHKPCATSLASASGLDYQNHLELPRNGHGGSMPEAPRRRHSGGSRYTDSGHQVTCFLLSTTVCGLFGVVQESRRGRHAWMLWIRPRLRSTAGYKRLSPSRLPCPDASEISDFRIRSHCSGISRRNFRFLVFISDLARPRLRRKT